MRYQARGFIPINEPPARRKILAATVEIIKGDFLVDNGSGYGTNADTSLVATGLGIAAASLDNSPAVTGAEVEYYPLDTKTQYIVPVAANALITQGAIGSMVDLEAVGTIDINEVVSSGIGFMIDSIDVSTDAIDANTYGYAIGHFVLTATQTAA